MAYCTVADINIYSRIDEDTLVSQVKFNDVEKQDAITQADARIDYICKDWATFYATSPVLTQITLMIKEVSIYYALYILFDKKSKIVMLMNEDVNNFSAGDLATTVPDSEKKSFYLQYQALSQVYKIRAEELLTLIVPPGSDSGRGTFSFEVGDAMED